MYNYQHFTPKEYDFSVFNGPKAGSPAIDFSAKTLDDKKVKLSDFFGKWIVLEFGSLTCPITESKVDLMNQVAQEFRDVTFLLLYVREAHPGESVGQHSSAADKMSCARRFRDEYQESRTILVDNLEGSAHKKYGCMPNSVYIINPEGKVVFRGDWNNIGMVKKILKERDSKKIYKKDRFSGRLYFGGKSRGLLSVLRSAGWQAVWDFAKALPKMVVMHATKPG